MENKVKLRRKLGIWAAIGASTGLVVSGTAMVALGQVAGIAGSGTWAPALIALIVMFPVAFAYGELTAMFPGSGMISDYTAPVLGKAVGVLALICAYVLLIACDGGTQQMIGALALEEITGVHYLVFAALLFCATVCTNIFGVQIYGRVEASLTVIMMGIFVLMALLGFFGVSGQPPVNSIHLIDPENGWGTAVACAGSAVWWYIGFEFVCPMAEEMHKPQKHVPIALITCLLLVFAADMLFAYAGVKFVDLDVMANSSTPQIEIAKAAVGPWGYYVVTAITILAAFTSGIGHMAALPRMLYGMAHKNMVPKFFAYIHPKFRTPIYGILFTAALITLTIIYMAFNGTDAAIITTFVNIACCSWLVSYGVALVDVIVYRKKYPNYPRLWKAPGGTPVMVLGIIGIIYCIWTMSDVWLMTGAAIAAFCIYVICWFRYKKIPLGEKEPIQTLIKSVQERSESLPEWDEAVNKWLASQEAK